MVVEVYDVGGTWIRGAIVDRNRILKFVKEGTQKDFCSQIKNISLELKKNFDVNGLVVLVPGPVVKGVLLKAPPLGIVNKIDVKKELKGFNANVYIENDLNAALQAELNDGIGRKYKNFCLLTISTGIGAGIVLNGRPVGGTSGEFGHCVIERRPEFLFQCGCGNKGCWASLSSGKAIENLAKTLIGRELSCEEVFKLAKKNGDVEKVISLIRDYNAHGIGNIINSFAFEVISVMGSIGREQFDTVIPSRSEIKRYTVNPVPKIIKSSFGDEIGLIGSYYIAKGMGSK